MSDYVVQIDTIEGESNMTVGTGTAAKKLIDCLSLHHAIELVVTNTSSTRVSGTSSHGPIELTHVIDAASPKIRHACASATNLGTVIIKRVASATAGNAALETITLSNAYVVRVDTDTPVDSQTALPADEPRESFSMEYSAITWQAAVSTETGQVSGQVESTYNTETATLE